MALVILGAPAGQGAGLGGTEAAPHAFRAAGLRQVLAALGHAVEDWGDIAPGEIAALSHSNPHLKALPEVAAWSRAIHDAVRAVPAGQTPLILGGDHSISLGSVPALAERAAAMGRPFFLLWIDAHPDCHTLATSVSGNLHGLPLAHAIAGGGPDSPFPGSIAPLAGSNVMLVGVREIDEAENGFLKRHGVASHGPEVLRTHGIAALLKPWLQKIAAVGGMLHISLDADALDPAVAPGVGTPVIDGLSADELGEIMTLAADAGVIGSLELVEVNPFLDSDGRTATAMIDAATRAFRRQVAGRRRAA